MTRDPDRPTVPEVVPSVVALYRRHSAGCCLHIMLDDGNVRDDDAAFCVFEAESRGHQDCAALARRLQQMTPSQRGRLRRKAREAEAAPHHTEKPRP